MVGDTSVYSSDPAIDNAIIQIASLDFLPISAAMERMIKTLERPPDLRAIEVFEPISQEEATSCLVPPTIESVLHP